MNKSLPKSDGSSFLLCEDVREEVNNKLSIIGVFPNDDIVLQKDILIPSLMAVLLARGGEGPCETTVSLTDPKARKLLSDWAHILRRRRPRMAMRGTKWHKTMLAQA